MREILVEIRASSMWSLMDCPLRWRKQHIEGMKLPSTGPAAIGTAVHASTAAYDVSRRDGEGLTIDDTAGIAVDLISQPGEDVNWEAMKTGKAIEIALNCHTSYCTNIAPLFTYREIEHTLAPLTIDMGDGVKIRLTGTLDRVRVDSLGQCGVGDVKTGGRAIAPDGTVVVGKHLPQLGEYQLLAEQEIGPMDLPPIILGLHTGGTGRAGVGEIHGAKEALVGNETEPGLLRHAAQFFRSGLFPPNPGSMLCSPKYCPYYKQCIYHG